MKAVSPGGSRAGCSPTLAWEAPAQPGTVQPSRTLYRWPLGATPALYGRACLES